MANSTWLIKKENFPKEGTLIEKMEFALNYAILSPSTHNTQPWLFKIYNNSCKIFINPNLKLPEADPKNRNLYISMGCMIENLFIASNYFGILKNSDIRPDQDFIGEFVFEDHMVRNESLGYLLDAIPKRVNARGIFDTKSLPSSIFDELSALNKDQNIKLNFLTDKNKIKQIGVLTAEGLRMAHSKKSFRQEMIKWMHNNLTTKKDGMPGYSLRMPFLLSFIIPNLMRFFDVGSLLAKLNYKSISSAPLVCVVSARENNVSTWIEIGRLSERCFLHLNAKSIRTSVFVASVEMGELYKKVQTILQDNLIPQFLFCVGYMNYELRHSPRQDLKNKIIS